MSVLFTVLSVFLFALVAGVAVKNNNLIQATTSMVWFAFMTLPFIYQWEFFPIEPRASQSIGIFFVSSALAAGDVFSIQYKKRPPQEIIGSNNQIATYIYALTLIVIFLPLFHYWQAETIPIIDQYFGGKTKVEIALERENFGKLLELPYFFKVLVNWISNIFGPLIIIWFITQKRYVLAVVLFLWTLFYAFSSSADAPVILFLWSFIFVITFKYSQFKSIAQLVSLGIVGGLLFAVLSGVMIGSAAERNSAQCSASTGVGFTPGDVLRSCSESTQIKINPVIDRLGYRYFLTPVEVSNRWYDYFDGNPSGHRKISNILERDLSQQASNKVGNWAYVLKFPDKYPTTISANTSIDADAYSFAGLPSLFFVAFLLFLIRAFLGFSISYLDESQRVLEGLALSQISFFAATAPLQAILLPQGLGLVLFCLLLLRRRTLLKFILSKVK